MISINVQSSRIFLNTLRCAAFSLLVLFCFTTVNAEESVTAQKFCPTTVCPAGPPITASFSITTAQIIRWTASYTGGPTDGHSFYLSTRGPNFAEPGVDTALTTTGGLGGEQFLNPGTYHISILPGVMGPGIYTVFFNRRAAISVSPAGGHSFGSIVAGIPPPAHPTFAYTVSYTGDAGLSVATSITSSDSSRFTVAPASGTVSAGSSLTFNVTFIRLPATTTPVMHSATITITGTSTVGPPITSSSRTVTGTSLPNVPDIDCAGGSCGTSTTLGSATNLGSADGDAAVPEVRTFNVQIRNVGTRTLNVASISLVNDIGSAFTLIGPTPPTIGASGSANVQVRFAPPPGEAIYCAHFVIASDDPDEGTKSCPFQAVGHHPVPQMRVTTSPLSGVISDPRLLDYGDVELGFTFRRAIVVFNDGDAPLTATVADNCTPTPLCTTDTTHARWPVRDRSTQIIAPGTNRVFNMDYRPELASPTPDEISMRVSGNDPDLADQIADVTLRGRGIAPIPIDSVLVLDRSGSMDDIVGPRKKIEALQTAASMFVDLLRPATGDKIGLVRYDHESFVYLPLDFLTATTAGTTHLDAALDHLSVAATNDETRIRPRGGTGIGSGMQSGAGMFPTGSLPPPTERRQAMVVLTDGQENVDPRVNVVLPGIGTDHPNLKIYSIGLGRATASPPEIDAITLQSITNVTRGYHQVSDDLSGLSRFELESFYFKIFTNAAGVSIVRDPTSSVTVSGAAPIVVDRAVIVSSDHSVVFMVVDDPLMRGFYQLEMLTPGGLVLTPATTVGGITVHQRRRHNYSIYRVIFPDESLASSYVGEWQLRLTPNGTWSEGSVKDLLQCPAPIGFHSPASLGIRTVAFSFAPPLQNLDTPCRRFQRRPDVINPFAGLVPVGFGAAVSSDYRMDVEVQPSHFLPTANVKLTAALTDRRAPALNGEVFVDATTPSKTLISGIRLFDDGTHGDDVASDGVWTNHFTQTIESGSYKFFFRGFGRNERGELAPREDTRYVTLMLPIPPGQPNGRDHGRTPWFSFHLGHSFPLGSFRKEFDSGPSVTVDVEFPFRKNLSIYSMFGYHYFHAPVAGSPNLSIKNFSLNLRAYFPVGSWQGFVQAGPGAYFQNPGANSFGYNVGTGLNFPVLPKLAIELGVDFHHLDLAGTNRKFVDPKLGIKFRF